MPSLRVVRLRPDQGLARTPPLSRLRASVLREDRHADGELEAPHHVDARPPAHHVVVQEHLAPQTRRDAEDPPTLGLRSGPPAISARRRSPGEDASRSGRTGTAALRRSGGSGRRLNASFPRPCRSTAARERKKNEPTGDVLLPAESTPRRAPCAPRAASAACWAPWANARAPRGREIDPSRRHAEVAPRRSASSAPTSSSACQRPRGGRGARALTAVAPRPSRRGARRATRPHGGAGGAHDDPRRSRGRRDRDRALEGAGGLPPPRPAGDASPGGGAVAPWISNRQNDLREAVERAHNPARW